jgi:GNAT superfamily N-acetyltransferase
VLSLRAAGPDDVPVIRRFIRELAAYEREPDAAVVTEDDLRRDGFGERPYFYTVLACWNQEPVGFALYFFNYSTWQGRAGLYIEDLFVQPAHRRRGIGHALLRHLAQVARERRCGRMVWQVLDWNEPALRFYESLGAGVRREWLTLRLEGDAIVRLAR